MSFGAVEGKSFKEGTGYITVEAVFDSWENGKFEVGYPQGESAVDVEARGVHGIKTVLSRNEKYTHVAIVAHGRFIKILLSAILYSNLGKMFDIEQDNCCINVIDYDREKHTFSPVILNYTGHLPSHLNI